MIAGNEFNKIKKIIRYSVSIINIHDSRVNGVGIDVVICTIRESRVQIYIRSTTQCTYGFCLFEQYYYI